MLIAASGSRAVAQVCALLSERHFLTPRSASTSSDLLSAIDNWASVPAHVQQAARDQLGPRKVVPLGAALVAIGAILFSTADPTWGSIGRFLQGAGGVFALIGAVYLVTPNMPVSRAATMIGVTQMFGMAGRSAGQFAVGPAIASGLAWDGAAMAKLEQMLK